MCDDRRLPVMVKNHMAWHVPHLQGIHRHLNVFTHDQWSKAPTDSLIICNPDELTDSDIQTQRATGKSIVVDNLWDGHTDIKDFSQANLVLSFDCFFWIHEHGFHRFANLDQITLQPSYHKRAFMPMRHARHFRERVLEVFAPLLSEMIWSYENHQLPNDIENRSDRYFNRSWYDDTCMSIVVETVMDTVLPFPFITEKTWKPIIFGHPFLIIGCAGTLAWLRDHGFETFDNMFDESYDQIPDWQERVRLVKHNASTAIGNPWDAETWRRIRHNQRVFFDDDIVQSMIKQNLIDPLANQYANAS